MTNKQIIRDFFIKSYQNHDYSIVEDYFAEDYYDHSPASARSNRDAIDILRAVEHMFGNMKLEILDLFEEDGMVATRIRFEGDHIGECLGVPATGRHICFEALENFRLSNSKVIESWGYWPDYEILKQLQGTQV